MYTFFFEFIVVSLLFAWLLATIVNQFPKLRFYIRGILNRDFFGFIPGWTFYAPSPRVTDIHLLYRDMDDRGKTGAWHQIALQTDSYWDPSWRRLKSISDLLPNLMIPDVHEPREPGRLLSKTRVLRISYLILLNLVSTEPRSSGSIYRQFTIAVTKAGEYESSAFILFCSAFHKVKAD